MPFRYKHKFIAKNGEDGKPEKFHGKTAEDLIIKVPQGTLIRDADTGKLLFDMGDSGRFVAAKGGRGGFGNVHFATPTRQIPRFAKGGTTGEERRLILELKLIADVGLIGFPNVGKSTLLSMVSEAKPKIANYHFTTLSPVLGVVKVGGANFVMADIPGLIEGASEGAGLGHDFLRHVDRCRLLVHVVDAAGTEGRDPVEDIEKINRELSEWSDELSSRKQIIVANKCDIGVPDEVRKRLENYAQKCECKLFFISAVTKNGVSELLKSILETLSTLPERKYYEPDEIEETFKDETVRNFEIEHNDDIWFIGGSWLEKVTSSVNFEDRESLAYFHKVLTNAGVFKKLEELGVRDGDTVDVCGFEFDYIK